MKTHKHEFLFEVEGNNGTPQKMSAWATVRTPKKAVKVVLNEAAVLRSMKLKGIGNSMKCSMACSLTDNVAAFPHPVVGPIDFLHRTCFVTSKMKNGLPSECYRYVHDFTWIAKLNDAKGGQAELLALLRRGGGITVTLRPRSRSDRTKKGGSGRTRDGTRSTRPIGARLRHANALAGLSIPNAD